MSVEDEVDALYAGDPDEFVPARQALVKRLRAEGDKGRAAEVAALRRPTAAAWAVNQLARRHGEELARLVALGDDLRQAHERLLAGDHGDASTVAAGRRRREAIADLVEQAAAILSESGRAADAHRDAISSTLDAASLDPSAGAEVLAGRLAKELEAPTGFGGGDGEELLWSAPAPARPAPASKSNTPAKVTKAAEPAKAAKTATAAAAAKSSTGAKSSTAVAKSSTSATSAGDADAEAGERAAARARRVDEARQRAESARTAATRARGLAEQARHAADRADAEHERLEAEVIRARRTRNDARRAARELADAAHEAERQATALEEAAGVSR